MVAVAQVLADALNIFEWRMAESRHFLVDGLSEVSAKTERHQIPTYPKQAVSLPNVDWFQWNRFQS
jgi:hypothetical protein